MNIRAKEFPYNTSAVSEKQYSEHMRLYKGYVDKTNEVTEALLTKPDESKANATYSKYRGLKKGETYSLNGVILHEGYFQNMTKEKTPLGKRTANMFQEAFGCFDNWKEDMTACGKAARGWAILVYEQRTDTFRNILLDTHDEGQICMAFPIVIMDMYEHSYFLDYGTDKDKYINNFLESINWNIVEKRMEKL